MRRLDAISTAIGTKGRAARKDTRAPRRNSESPGVQAESAAEVSREGVSPEIDHVRRAAARSRGPSPSVHARCERRCLSKRARAFRTRAGSSRAATRSEPARCDLIRGSTGCRRGERRVTWSRRGPIGPRGLQGAVGAQGATGSEARPERRARRDLPVRSGPAVRQGLAAHRRTGPVGPAGGARAHRGAIGTPGPAGPAGCGRGDPAPPGRADGPAGQPAWTLLGRLDLPDLQGPAGAPGPEHGTRWTSRSRRVSWSSGSAAAPSGPAGPAGPAGPRGPLGHLDRRALRPAGPAGPSDSPGACGGLRHVGGGSQRGADLFADEHVPGRKEDPGRRLHLHASRRRTRRTASRWTRIPVPATRGRRRCACHQNLGGGVTISLSVYAVCTV